MASTTDDVGTTECFATDQLPAVVRLAVYDSRINLFSTRLLAGIRRGAPAGEMAERIKRIRTEDDAVRVELWAARYGL